MERTFRTCETVLMKSRKTQKKRTRSTEKQYKPQEKLFIASIFLAAFSLGILTVTGLHLMFVS
jgi:hypothetical protein